MRSLPEGALQRRHAKIWDHNLVIRRRIHKRSKCPPDLGAVGERKVKRGNTGGGGLNGPLPSAVVPANTKKSKREKKCTERIRCPILHPVPVLILHHDVCLLHLLRQDDLPLSLASHWRPLFTGVSNRPAPELRGCLRSELGCCGERPPSP